MNINYKMLRRPAAALTALALVVGSVGPMMNPTSVSAAQVQSRSIQMSNATPGATATYKVQFDVATAGVIQAVTVDFCQESPLMEDTNCTLPAGMNIAGATLANVTNLDAGFAVQYTNTNRTADVYNAGASTSTTVGTTASFELVGVVNPSATGTFYARIQTYAVAANGASHTPGSTTNLVDFGGIAMAITNAVQITAKVQEQLVFCVSGAAVTDNCAASVTAPNVNLGTLSGGNYILDTTGNFSGSVFTRLSTNALEGAVVRVKTTSSTSCSGLSSDNGTTCAQLPAVGATPTVLTGDSVFGFGMCVVPGGNSAVLGSYASATSCSANNATTGWIMTDTAATSTYGDDLFNTNNAPVNLEDNQINYGVSRQLVTPAGIYKTTQSMIATGTF